MGKIRGDQAAALKEVGAAKAAAEKNEPASPSAKAKGLLDPTIERGAARAAPFSFAPQ